MTDKQDELERSERKLQESIDAYFSEAQEWARQGMQAQGALAEKLLLASGGALGILSTLFATDVSSIQATDFIGPVVTFIVSMIAAGIGLWSRPIAFFKNSSHALWQSARLAFMKAEAEKRFLGKPHTCEPPQQIKRPEGWFNVLDYCIGVSGISFTIAVAWTALNFAL